MNNVFVVGLSDGIFDFFCRKACMLSTCDNDMYQNSSFCGDKTTIVEFCSGLDSRADGDSNDDVRVFARFRPLNARERALPEDENKVTYKLKDDRTIEIDKPSSSTTSRSEFTFDGIFPESTTQSDLYVKTAKPLVGEVLKGFNCTMMAYGQTGSGKSYSMTGRLGDEEQEGIIPRMIRDLFDAIESRREQSIITIQCSYVEIYLERVRDLLNPRLDNLKLREKGSTVYIEGATSYTVRSLNDMLKVMHQGDSNRITAATDMNERSSRSHSVFVVTVTQTEIVKGTRRSSKLFLVDLAGSEQVDRSGATGLKLEQAKKINKSLSALSLVIQSLVEKKKGAHIPYRDSKLTRLLTESLGGNSKTILLLAMSPSRDSLVETYSTLGFGSRAKKMTNKATVNEELVMAKELDVMKRRAEDTDQKYQALFDQHQRLFARHQSVVANATLMAELLEMMKQRAKESDQQYQQLLDQYLPLVALVTEIDEAVGRPTGVAAAWLAH